MIREYETIVIAKADVKDSYVGTLKKKVEKLMETKPGSVTSKDDWGVKKLAYEIKHEKMGRYLFWKFSQEGETLLQLDRLLRFDENIVRYMTFKAEAPEKPKTKKKKAKAAKPKVEDPEKPQYRNIKVDYKDPTSLARYITERGKISPRRQARMTAGQQRKVAIAIKRARQLALISYTEGLPYEKGGERPDRGDRGFDRGDRGFDRGFDRPERSGSGRGRGRDGGAR